MTTKTFLVISLSLFAASTTGLLWGLFLPAGAITFGLFMICKVLDKEAALFDADHQTNARPASLQDLSTNQDSHPFIKRTAVKHA